MRDEEPPTGGRQFIYDVAFSFLAEDESVAALIADRVRERLSVFIYSERQEDLVGGTGDGIDKFSAAFQSQSRVCVILYRPRWGETNWTRIEETAIKNRGYDAGYDFLIVISLAGGQPDWVPKPNLWLIYETYGVDGAAAVIEARVNALGGLPREESAVERAGRIERTRASEVQRRRFLAGDAGVRAAHAAIRDLSSHIKQRAEQIAATAPAMECRFTNNADGTVFGVSTSDASVSLGWAVQYRDSLEGASLLVREFAGRYMIGTRERDAARETSTTLDVSPEGLFRFVWPRAPERNYSPEQFAELVFKMVLDRAEQTRAKAERKRPNL